MHHQVVQNTRRSLALATGFVIVIAAVISVVLALFGLGLVGVGIGLVLALGIAFWAYTASEATVLRLSGAAEADEVTFARLHNVVDGLCIASGLPKPRLYAIDDPAPNALAAGRNPKHALVAVTTGLLDTMNRVELEAVLAHELSQVKSGAILPASLAVTMLGLPSRVVPALLARLLPVVVGDDGDASADLSAITMTRYPPGLIAALEKLRDDTSVVQARHRAIAHLWIEAPVPGVAAAARPYPPIEERIDVLRELS